MNPLPPVPAEGLRALILYDCVYPESIGGVEKRNAEIARALAARGHHVTIAGPTQRPGPRAEGYSTVDIAGARARPWRGGRRGLADTLRYARWAQRLDLSGFDVVETANIPYAHLPVVARLARAARRPWVVTWHEFWGPFWKTFRDGDPSWPLFALFERRAARWADVAIAPSRLTAERVAAHRGRPVAVVPGGVWSQELARIEPARAPEFPPPAPLVVANRLIADKRTDLLLRALALIAPRRGEGVLLDVIGTGPEGPALERLAAELGVADRIRFRGRLETSEAVWRTIRAARIAVQPSGREGFGLYPLEALALGTPVVHVSSADSAVHEIVRHDVEGLQTDPTPAALARALEQLLDDEPRRGRMSAAGRARALEFDWRRIAATMEEILTGVRLERPAAPDPVTTPP